MVDFCKTTSQFAVGRFKVEATARNFAEQATVMIAAEGGQFGAAETHFTLAVKDKLSLLFSFDG